MYNPTRDATINVLQNKVGNVISELSEVSSVNADGLTIAEATRIGQELNSSISKLYRTQVFITKINEPVVTEYPVYDPPVKQR